MICLITCGFGFALSVTNILGDHRNKALSHLVYCYIKEFEECCSATKYKKLQEKSWSAVLRNSRQQG
jgi:hypothetical protein